MNTIYCFPSEPVTQHPISEPFETKCFAAGGRPTPTQFQWRLNGDIFNNVNKEIIEEDETDEYGYHTVSQAIQLNFTESPPIYLLECRAVQEVNDYNGIGKLVVIVEDTTTTLSLIHI